MHVAGAMRDQDLALGLIVGDVEVHALVVDTHLLVGMVSLYTSTPCRPPRSICRILTGASEFTWKGARNPLSKCTVTYATFSRSESAIAVLSATPRRGGVDQVVHD